MEKNGQVLRVKRLGIDTYKEAVIYMRKDCPVCRAEGYEAQARIRLTLGNRSVIATLNIIDSDLLNPDEASLSNYAWDLLKAEEDDEIYLSHPKPLESLSYIRAKVYGNELNKNEINTIINDLVAGYLSDVHIATFLVASADARLNTQEVYNLTDAMIKAGSQLSWPAKFVVDKHCVGGLPGNRTSMIVVPIVTAFGLTMPKTSSRAITSPSGTADTMEVLAPVDLDISRMRKIIEKENGCIIWGGAVTLSPADDILIRIERIIDLDSEGQLVASILSKKIAAGARHIVIDVPIGPTAKVRTFQTAHLIKELLLSISKKFGVEVKVVFTDGRQPIGRGIGPALEAKDVLAVLQNEKQAPQDLRERALVLAGEILEFSPKVKPGTGKLLATTILNSGQAWKKFQAICDAQGGMREIPQAKFTYVIKAKNSGIISDINNRLLSRTAKLAGAPNSKAAGVELFVSLESKVEREQPLFSIHSETPGELKYTLEYIQKEPEIFQITPL